MEQTTTKSPASSSGGLAEEHIVLICGVLVFIIAIIALVVFIYMLRRKRSREGTQHLIEEVPRVDMQTHNTENYDLDRGYRTDTAEVHNEEQTLPHTNEFVEETDSSGATYIELEVIRNGGNDSLQDVATMSGQTNGYPR